jgi:NitT/TauT family transport system substrate-binding protein
MRAVDRSLTLVATALLLVASAACARAPAPASPASGAPSAAGPASAAAPPTAPSGAPAAAPAAAAPSSAAPSAPPRTVKVTLGVLGTTSDGPMFVAYDRGYFKEQGLDVELVPFATSTEMIAPLSTNQLQVGAGGINAGLLNAIQRGVPLKFVADKNHTPPEYKGSGWIVRKDLLDAGAIREPRDLKGRVVGLGSTASVADSELNVLLQRGGLSMSDVEIKDLKYADQPVAFSTKAVDIAYTFEPFSGAVIRAGFADMWLTSGSIIPNHEQSIVMFSPKFAEDADAGTRWMIGYIRGVREMKRAFATLPGDEGVARILTEHTNVKDVNTIRNSPPGAVNPNGYLFGETIQLDQEFWVASGAMAQPVDLAQVIDHSFIDAALQVIGRE